MAVYSKVRSMKESIRFKITELVKIKDKHGNRCPKDLPKLLHEAGVESFSYWPQGLDWDVVRGDASVLRARLVRKG